MFAHGELHEISLASQWRAIKAHGRIRASSMATAQACAMATN
jgi:hypothetical protein